MKMKMKMKQNIIFPIEFNHCTGGMIQSVISIIGNLSKDYNVFILANNEAEVFKLGLNAGHLILHHPMVISISNPFQTIKTYLECKKIMKNFTYENTLVFTNNVGSEMIFSGFGFFSIPIKRVFVSRGGDYLGKTGWIIKKGFNNVNQFIAISNRQVQVLLKSGVPEPKILLIHNGILYQGSSNYKYSFNKNGTITISVIGYISQNKNQLLAVKAIAALLKLNYNVILNVYGVAVADSDKVYEKHLIKEINLLRVTENVFFKGFVQDQRSIYEQTDILVSSSLSEGFGRTVAEAMAFGIPCIGLRESGGLLDIITDNHDGVLINNNINELTRALVKIIDNEYFRNELSANAINTYHLKFTENVMIAKYKLFLHKFFNQEL